MNTFKSRRPLILLLATTGILAITLVAASGGGYVALARKELTDGQAAYAVSDWLPAYSHFNRVTGLYRLGIPDRLQEAEALKAETGLLSYAEDRRSDNDFESALAAYATALKLFPASANREQTTNMAGETYSDWVVALHTSQDYPLAIQKSQELLLVYPDSTAARSVDELTASTDWAWSVTLQQQGNFESALEKLELIQRDYPQTSYGLKVRSQLAELYHQWGQTLGENKDWAGAVEKYNRLRAEFVDQPVAQNTDLALARLYLQWADSQSKAQNYAVAIEKYNILLRDFPVHPEAGAARVALAETELRYANQLQASGQEVLAILYASHGLDLYEGLLADDPDSITTEQSELAHGTYRDIGQLLIDTGHYLSALQLYSDADSLFTDPDSQAEWQAGQATVTQALSADSGTDGQQVIAETVQSACKGQPTTWQIVGSSSEAIQLRLCPNAADISLGNLEADTPSSLHYVVDSESISTTVNSCVYTGAHVLTRYRSDIHLIIYDAVTGAIATQATVNGPVPPSCPGTYVFPSSAFSTASISGGEPSSEAVQQVLSRLLVSLK